MNTRSNITTTILLLLAVTLLVGCAGIKKQDLTDRGDGTMQLSSSPLQWQLVRSPNISSWNDASKYVNSLELGGHNDWRLPTREELLDLHFVFDFGNAKEGDVVKKIEGYYWVAEKDGTGYIGSWKDGDSCEITRNFNAGSRGGHVRAVRP